MEHVNFRNLNGASFSHWKYQESRVNSLSAKPTKRSSTLKQFVANLPTNCLSVFDHFVKLALKGLMTFDTVFH